MKRIIFLLFAAALAAACEGTIPYEPDNAEDMLILNGMLETGQTTHCIHVAVSGTSAARKVSSATLRCYVNGTEVAHTSSIENPDGYYGTDSRLWFNADFTPGDIVRIEVEANGRYSAWCEQTVPAPPVIIKADTVSTTYKQNTNSSLLDCLRFDVEVSDAGPTDNYYRIGIADRRECTFYKDRSAIGKLTDESNCFLYTDNDIILNDGHVGSNDDDSVFEMGVSNEFGVFSNARFIGKQATLHPMVSKDELSPFSSEKIEGADTVVVRNSAVVKVYSISQRYYYYFKALNALRNGSTDLALEDVSIPDNIEGGIGFIGIASPSEISFRLVTVQYPVEGLYY